MNAHPPIDKKAIKKSLIEEPFVSSLVLNHDDELGYFYGKPFEFTPQWASVDVELGELFIGGDKDKGEGRSIRLDKINQTIYSRVHKHKRLFIVEVSDNDIRKPKDARWVPLMVPTQLSEEEQSIIDDNQ